MTSTRDRLIQAAFDLFEERGFEATTVDDIAERAGVGRTTFFRTLGGKEDVIFPDHDTLVRAIESRLATATDATALVAISEASKLVLRHYLTEGSRARTRYALTRSVPALRSREIAGQQRYQRTFRTFLHAWMGGTPGAALRAELMANAVVTAHNHVLRRWLRGELTDSALVPAFDDAVSEVSSLFEERAGTHPDPEAPAAVVILSAGQDLSALLPQLRLLADSPPA